MKVKFPVFIMMAVIMLSACKKRDITAEGPTDVRIFNETGQVVNEVTVTTTDDTDYTVRVHNFGTVANGAYSDYFRFDIAFTEADITLKIGDVTYSTPASQFDYLTFIGTDRITYILTISDAVNHILEIETVIEEPIDDL